MEPYVRSDQDSHNALDQKTLELIFTLSHDTVRQPTSIDGELRQEISQLFWQACKKQMAQPIFLLFKRLLHLHSGGIGIISFGICKDDLCVLALKHQQITEDPTPLGSLVNQED